MPSSPAGSFASSPPLAPETPASGAGPASAARGATFASPRQERRAETAGGSLFSPPGPSLSKKESPLADHRLAGRGGGAGGQLPRASPAGGHGLGVSGSVGAGSPLISPARSAGLSSGGDGKHFVADEAAEAAAISSPRLQAQRSPLKQSPVAPSPAASERSSSRPSGQVPPSSADDVRCKASQETLDFVERLRMGYQHPQDKENVVGQVGQPKQTDDSGFDSDEKAQQQHQQSQELLRRQEELQLRQKQGEQLSKQNHLSEQQGGRGRLDQWDAVNQQSRLQQQQQQLLANMNPYERQQMTQAQSEAFYNYVYDMERKRMQANMNVNYGGAGMQTSQQQQQQQQQYMQQFFDGNLEVLSQIQQYNPEYFQYMQQHMQQVYGAASAAAAGNNHLKDLQALEQLFTSTGWSAAQSSSWLTQAEQMSKQYQQQQQQQQQKHHNNQLLQQQQQQHSRQSQSSTQQSYHFNKESALRQQHQPQQQQQQQQQPYAASHSKVQNSSSPSSAPHRRSSKDSPRRQQQPSQSPRVGGGPHAQFSAATSTADGSATPAATPVTSLPGHPARKVSSSEAPSEQVSIPKDLLDSVEAVTKMPSWKAGAENAAFSTRKTPDGKCELARRTSSSAVAATPARSEGKESQDLSVSDADYDHTMGGVDYDDYDFEDEYKPKGKAGAAKKARAGAGGAPRGKGRGARVANRGRPRYKPVNIDVKALAKVQKTVAGTDYDFGDEFADDFSDVKTPDLSLQALREQTKRQNAILDARTEGGDEAENVKKDVFDMDDEFGGDAEVPVKPARGRGRAAARGRGRARTQRKAPSVGPPSPSVSEPDDSGPPPPPLPKLKLGQLLIRKDSPKGSPKAPKVKGKHDRRSSFDKEQPTKVVPKLKIKLGPKPAESTSVKAEDEKPNVKSEPSKADKDKERETSRGEAPTSVKAESKKEEEAKMTIGKVTPKASPARNAISSPGSPSKKVSKIDMLANKLLDAKQVKPGEKADSVAAIFGPAKPLDMSSSAAANASSATGGSNEERSELDLLQEEMRSMHRPAAVLPKKQAAAAAARAFEEDSARSQHLKMKFKRHATSQQQSSSNATNNETAGNVAQATATTADNMQSVHPRMRKKEILSKYFGGDAYPATPAANGPTLVAPPDTPPVPAVRNFIKMPKAVASVTSVPTRADYQHQLEANAARKRKQMGLDVDDIGGKSTGGNDKSSKKKKGRGGKGGDNDGDYRPKIAATEKKETARKTRGKPPKKCLAESPPHEEPGDLKAESMKYAEQILSTFHEEDKVPKAKAKGRPKKGAKRKAPAAGGAKTPRLVIKFSKDGGSSGKNSKEPSPPPANTDETAAKKNGLDAYNFVDDDLPMVDGNVEEPVAKVPKLKIKI